MTFGMGAFLTGLAIWVVTVAILLALRINDIYRRDDCRRNGHVAGCARCGRAKL